MPDTPLFSSPERFDSFALLELVIRLESAFDLSIPDEDLDPEAFSSPRSIASYLLTRLQAGGAAGSEWEAAFRTPSRRTWPRRLNK